jgi:transcriptional regulator with GAF, ATPase, and Fis domain/CHASE2 domain-containing sensor protein
MKELSVKLNLAATIKAAVIVLVFVLLLFATGSFIVIDNNLTKLFYKTGGEAKPDTNIVIIHITESDIESIGPWPVKRSFYALLINSLNELKVSKIGLEVFLSARFAAQAVYDNLLTREIEKAGNVVLSSVAGNVSEWKDYYLSDSLSYPSPKLLNESLITGHLNYLDEKGIKIPLTIKTANETEKAFSLMLSGIEDDRKEIYLNIFTDWKNFTNYSLLDFFDLFRNDIDSLSFLKDKIVLIGISDPQLAFSLSGNFGNLPGAALHAFAGDNLINNRTINYNFYYISAVLFFIFFILLVFVSHSLTSRLIRIYLYSLIAFIILSLLLFNIFYIKLFYTAFVIPFLFLILFDAVNYFLEKQRIFKSTVTESEVLKSLLKKKEQELALLQKEHDSAAVSASLNEKINALKNEINRLKEKDEDLVEAEISFKSQPEIFYGIVYRSKAVAKVVDLIKRTAPEDATVLILGESGTGKELAAKAVHTLSKRSGNNFVAVNCGALSDSLLESELFGHVKGAFTGSVADKIGRFEAADRGTIFLDEIAETSENFQVKLLRVIQSGEFEKAGSSKTQRADVRIIAATNKNLESAVKEKKFREDLYYRLNVIKIELPPLREHKEDIEVLIDYFIRRESPGVKISQAVVKAMKEYQWKGNVRELESAIKRAYIYAKSSGRDIIQLSDLPSEIVKNTSVNFEDVVIESLRSRKFSHSSVTETAKELGNVSRTLVSENFRGFALKTLVENNFSINEAAELISSSEDEEINERVRTKLEIFLSNIESDVKNLNLKEFEAVKSRLSSKYKNLPQRFHYYLDESIRYFISGK